MIFEFKTKHDSYGRRKHLVIDTDRKIFTREDEINPDGIEIKVGDYKELVQQCEDNHYTER